MNKKILIVLLASLLMYLSFFALFLFLSKKTNQSNAENSCIIIEDCLKKDEAFQQQYGNVLSVSYDNTQKIKYIEDHHVSVPCIIQTETTPSLFVWVDCYRYPSKAVVHYDTIYITPQ